MKEYKLQCIDDGLMMHRHTKDGWQHLSNPAGGGICDSRGQHGWWLYKGDEALARQEQARRWISIKERMDHYYSQPWV